MKKFKFYMRIYIKILVQDIKSKMSYREDFFISVIGIIFTNLAGFISFGIIFENFPSLGGWNYYEMLFFYGFSLVAITPMQCLFDNNWNLRGYIYTGDFIKYCFRPLNLFFYYISEIFDIKGLGQLVFGVIMLQYSWIHLELGFDFITVIELLICLPTASLFMIAIMNLAAATNFFILNSGYVMVTVFKFTDYVRYPNNIYNNVIKNFFRYIVPIAFVSYFPSRVFLTPDDIPPIVYVSPILGMLFFYISYRAWMFGASRYAGTGS
ncbi:ABC transporter permease [Anaeromicropila populeti]|uniref:ABC-2 type transport system permease protein n=1 Tax=Anaeromicropila populeti TaxID=37658 RepID=A0A1I6LW24_9FIRM|nr:ABC-2 family transporter protein [Anaeromicropila populeti]SFS07600.1 ABC-2 type transport system permease protein [Anaeromicropila populeti]